MSGQTEPPSDEVSEGSPNPHLLLKLPKKPFFLAIVLVVTFLLAEGVHRFVTDRKLKRRAARKMEREAEKGHYTLVLKTSNGKALTEKKGNIVFVRDSRVLYRLEPNQKTSVLTTNSLGFRGKEWPKKEKPVNTKRVLIIGSSVVFGFGVKDDKVIAAVLEKKIREGFPKSRIEVLNAGVPGYLSHQDLALFSTELINYNADLIILFNGWNDFNYGGLAGKDESVKSWMFNEVEILLNKKDGPRHILQFSSLYRSLEKKLFPNEQYKAVKGGKSFFQKNDHARLDYLHHVEVIIRLAKSYGTKVLVSPQPELTMREGFSPIAEQKATEGKYPPGYIEWAKEEYPKYREGASLLAERHGVSYLDTQTLLKNFPEKMVFTDAVHFNELGYELCADALLPKVVKILGL